MRREVRFRGKRFDNNNDDWIYGYLHVIDTNGEGYTGKAIQQQHGTSRPYSVRVHDESVGEYTGLSDKNGVDIYEGDIVSTDLSRPYNIVEFQNGAFVFACHDDGVDYIDLMQPLASADKTIKYGEVIGNIYDNEDLLKGEESE